MSDIREKLRIKREERIHPYRDEKIVTAWNGMMITSLAIAGELLNDQRYREAAITAAQFIWKHNRADDGGLWRTHLHGSSSIDATQEDYAYYAEALLQLYDMTGDAIWLDRTIEIYRVMIDRFWDKHMGGFFMSQKMGPGTMGRLKESSDGAIPSGNSVALRVLQQLSVRTGDSQYREKAEELLNTFSSKIHDHPRGYSYMLLAANALINGETGHYQYAGKGNVIIHGRLEAITGSKVRVVLKLKINKGWHINSNQPLQDELIATALSTEDEWNLLRVAYPVAIQRRLGFQHEELALYEGDIQLIAEAENRADERASSLPLKLNLQVCSDKICLAPETVALSIPLM